MLVQNRLSRSDHNEKMIVCTHFALMLMTNVRCEAAGKNQRSSRLTVGSEVCYTGGEA